MKERPILFSTKMVQAILARRKTQTRRIATKARCPYGEPGDQLWVREGFWIEHDSDNFECQEPFDCGIDLRSGDWARVQYVASHENPAAPTIPGEWFGPDEIFPERCWIPWGVGAGITPRFFSKRPGIHMPRWASRITLGVVSTRKEPLQAITEEDAVAESFSVYESQYGIENDAREMFAMAWDEINGDRALWNSNPDVWRVEFGVIATEAA